MAVEFDLVVIGSGAGGLTAALAAARAGKKVAVFEQHSLPGGWCHTFRLGGYSFSPGVHYIGQLQPGGSLRALYEGLGLGPDLTFYELNPKAMDQVYLGEERYDIPKGKQAFVESLAQRFPQERRGIQAYLDAVERLSHQLTSEMKARGPKALLTLPYRARDVLRWAWRTGDTMIRHFVKDPRLIGVLSAQAGDHGLPPSQVSAAVHAAITAHYFDGGWYPKGGGGALPRAFVRGLVAHGGAIHLRTPVQRLLIEKGRVLGVRLQDGTEVRAHKVISNADPGVTFGKLVPQEHLSSARKKRLKKAIYSVSSLSLFLASRVDPRKAGLDSGNTWLYPDSDVNQSYLNGLTPWIPSQGLPTGVFLTVTTLKDPSKDYDGIHTMEAFSFVSFDAYRKFAGSTPETRPSDYEDLKEQVQTQMLQVLEKRLPGLTEGLEFSALGTPLTNVHYCEATEGSLYGTAKLRSQVGPFSDGIRTEFENLYLCGASTLSHGVAGATSSGVSAAARALGCRGSELLQSGLPPITLLAAENSRNSQGTQPSDDSSTLVPAH